MTLTDVAPEVITGDGGDNHLVGGAGGDRFDGGAGNDTLIGGAGDDMFVLSAPTDQGIEAANGGIDTVVAGFSATLAGNIGNLTLTGTAALTGTDSALGNQLLGNDGTNLLRGLGGNDFLGGGGGIDMLAGGAGADGFFFLDAPNPATNRAVISDFSAADDTIYLLHTVYAALGALGNLAPDAFWAPASGVAHDGSDRVIYNTTTGVLSYDSNGDLAGEAVQFAILTGHPAGLPSADFWVG